MMIRHLQLHWKRPTEINWNQPFSIQCNISVWFWLVKRFARLALVHVDYYLKWKSGIFKLLTVNEIWIGVHLWCHVSEHILAVGGTVFDPQSFGWSSFKKPMKLLVLLVNDDEFEWFPNGHTTNFLICSKTQPRISFTLFCKLDVGWLTDFPKFEFSAFNEVHFHSELTI